MGYINTRGNLKAAQKEFAWNVEMKGGKEMVKEKEGDSTLIKWNPEQRKKLEYLKQVTGLKGIHGEDAKIVKWALEYVELVILTQNIDRLLQFKGIVDGNLRESLPKRIPPKRKK